MEYPPLIMFAVISNLFSAGVLIRIGSRRLARVVVFSNALTVFHPAVVLVAGGAGALAMLFLSLFFMGWVLAQIIKGID